MSKRKPKLAPPDRLSPDDAAYLAGLIRDSQAAQQALAEAKAAWGSFSRHLQEKYGLGEKDAVTETGEIVRGPAPE